jgi:hypothetical protein
MAFLTEEVSSVNLTPTLVNPPDVSLDGRFGTAADFGSGKALYQASSPAKLNTTNFTVSFWLKGTSLVAGEGSYGTRYSFLRYSDNSNASTYGYEIFLFGGQFQCYPNGGGMQPVSDSYFSGTEWNHVAWVRSGTNWWIFINGISRYSRTGFNPTLPSTTRNLYIGFNNQNEFYFPDLIDEIEITNNAKWTTNFSVPAQPGVVDGNTVFLAHFNEPQYRVQGTVSADCRILIIDETTRVLESDDAVSAGSYELTTGDNDAKIIMAIPDDTAKNSITYRNVTPVTL